MLKFLLVMAFALCSSWFGWLPIAQAATNQSADYVLAISWQPAFCEAKAGRPIECRGQTNDRFDAQHFSLHGLWTQGAEYCQVSPKIRDLDSQNNWAALPPLKFAKATAKQLALKMPGAVSNLDRHEWYKHGTCYSATAEEYFSEAIALLDQVNESSVRQFFLDHIDQEVNASEIREAFDQAFGAGAGSKVQIECERYANHDRQRLIYELEIGLSGRNIQPDTPIKSLIQAAQVVDRGCPRGTIDRVGIGG
jgi:ribonuclease T2